LLPPPHAVVAAIASAAMIWVEVCVLIRVADAMILPTVGDRR
jgi:hypothetical protein